MSCRLPRAALLAFAFAFAVVGVVGCTTATFAPEQVAVPAAMPRPGGRVAARYWVELKPKSGGLALFTIKEGNVIERGELVAQAQRFHFDPAPCDGNGVC